MVVDTQAAGVGGQLPAERDVALDDCARRSQRLALSAHPPGAARCAPRRVRRDTLHAISLAALRRERDRDHLFRVRGLRQQAPGCLVSSSVFRSRPAPARLNDSRGSSGALGGRQCRRWDPRPLPASLAYAAFVPPARHRGRRARDGASCGFGNTMMAIASSPSPPSSATCGLAFVHATQRLQTAVFGSVCGNSLGSTRASPARNASARFVTLLPGIELGPAGTLAIAGRFHLRRNAVAYRQTAEPSSPAPQPAGEQRSRDRLAPARVDGVERQHAARPGVRPPSP